MFRFLCISRTCKHFAKLIEDRCLWKTFDFSTRKMMGRQIKKLLTTLQIGDIREFKVRGFVSKYPLEKWKNNTITPNILRKLSSSCPNLETMEILNSYINFHQVSCSIHSVNDIINLRYKNDNRKNVFLVCFRSKFSISHLL